MNRETENHWLTSVTLYGAALAGLSLCGHATAGTVSLGTNFATVGFGGSSTTAQTVQLGGLGSVGQYNDSYGKTIFAGFGIDQLRTVASSVTLNAATFTGVGGTSFSTNESRTLFFGFLSDSNQLGWFKVAFGGTGGAVVYLAGAYSDTPGQSIHVGTVPVSVPEPSSPALLALGALAAGASGVRKLRERKQRHLDV